MKVLGLIVEYNPFHKGHLYHLEQSRKISGADFTVCVMSGNFIQRGEPAIINKWARTKAAISAGIDLVIELPVVFSMASAEYFAYGAVKILNSLGIVDSISFGSESGDIAALEQIADILANEPPEFKSILKKHISCGISFPSARSEALTDFFRQSSLSGYIPANILQSSNNILGVEYLKALKRLKSAIKPLTIPRISNAYNDESLTGNISSATAIRKTISQNGHVLNDDIQKTLPAFSSACLEEEIRSGRGPIFGKNLEHILLSILRRMPREQLKQLPYIAEGLENRIWNAACRSGSWDELVEKSCTRRYTRTRIQRILMSSITGMTAQELDTFMEYGGPQYLRVLGFNSNGRKLLAKINRTASLPVIIKAADFQKSCNPLLRRMLEIEASATDIFVLAYPNPVFRKAGQEFTQNIIRINV